MNRLVIFWIIIVIILFSKTLSAQPKTDSFLLTVLKNANDTLIKKVIQEPMKYRCQIIYTQINRDKHNKPTLTDYYFNYDPQLYFNPASTVKLPAALLALEKLNNLKKNQINKYTTIQFDSSFPGQKAMYNDSTAPGNKPTIAHFIKRAFLISENDPYNRLYQFIGQHTFNKALASKGYKDVRIVRQFLPFTTEQNRHTNGLRFLNKNNELLYEQPAAFNLDSFDFSTKIKLGKAHYNRNDSLINSPFDFTEHNNISLEVLQQLLQAILFPATVPPLQRFTLSKDDYRFLYRYLSQYPSETDYPKYDTSVFYDGYVKFFFRNTTRRMPEHIRVFNKVGWSYGFLTDVSYIVDFKNKVEFMLSATLYVNSDEILNDGKYDYETIGYPFLYHLGQAVYKYELGRTREYKPNLTKFKLKYKHRDNDKRPVLREVDN